MFLMWPTRDRIRLWYYTQTAAVTTHYTQYSSFLAISDISGQSRVFLSHRDGHLMDEWDSWQQALLGSLGSCKGIRKERENIHSSSWAIFKMKFASYAT